jgi:uncharacterized protein with HEPN domain
MSRDDLIRLHHMLEEAKEASASVLGRTRSDLDHNHVWVMGLVKCVEIIGEAAAHIGETTRQRYPQIPWTQLVGMRNRLVHAYFNIDLEQVWKAITEDLPPLIAQLEWILDREDVTGTQRRE